MTSTTSNIRPRFITTAAIAALGLVACVNDPVPVGEVTTLLPDARSSAPEVGTSSPDARMPDLVSNADLAPEVSIPEEAPAMRQPRSYMAHATLGLKDMHAQWRTQEILVRLDPTEKSVVVGVSGSAARAPLQIIDEANYRTLGPIRLSLPTKLCGVSVTYATMAFKVTGEQVTGDGNGTLNVSEGDTVSMGDFSFTFTGSLDRTAPTFGADLSPVDPLPTLLLPASEPLPFGAKGRLVAGGEFVDLVPVSSQNSFVVSGFQKSDRALRYGTTYELLVDPATDLAGNAATATTKVVTEAAPPVLAEDGFESAGETVAGVSVVTGPSVLPPIAGQKSLLIRRGNTGRMHFAVRLPVAPGDKMVRFSLRPLAMNPTGVATGTAIRLAVPGGKIVNVPLPATETLSAEQVASGFGRVYLGNVRTLEVPLPADAVSEVVFDVTAGIQGPCSGGLPDSGYLIDDLRVE